MVEVVAVVDGQRYREDLIVVSAELLGLSQSTAKKRAVHSQTGWADYLAAHTANER